MDSKKDFKSIQKILESRKKSYNFHRQIRLGTLKPKHILQQLRAKKAALSEAIDAYWANVEAEISGRVLTVD